MSTRHFTWVRGTLLGYKVLHLETRYMYNLGIAASSIESLERSILRLLNSQLLRQRYIRLERFSKQKQTFLFPKRTTLLVAL
jgi:hypothetical protein